MIPADLQIPIVFEAGLIYRAHVTCAGIRRFHQKADPVEWIQSMPVGLVPAGSRCPRPSVHLPARSVMAFSLYLYLFWLLISFSDADSSLVQFVRSP